ncbi:preprotein translocase subunit SecE [uncultured Victivallis sp.]|uniref:preprotein translocase subunit SecE n=1 Tax=uncultured Victivallis sp. TaxID=354118 RepID=UPI0025E3E84E|nr:preprotein translocase subunit SecE [uncultured Victivallis sp.]
MDNGKKRVGAVAGYDLVTGKIRRFISETVAELRRCTWPNRQQLFESTVLVVICIAILACFVAGVDWVAAWVIRLITVGKY